MLGKYKHGKQTKAIDFETFKSGMDSDKFKHPLRDRSYLAFLYWSGVRKSEAYERVKEDFTINKNFLFVECPAKKHGERGGPLRIRLELPYVDIIIKRVDKTRKNRRVWSFSSVTAWIIVKRVFSKLYPHFFRFNRAVLFCSDPETSTVDVKSWFGWKSSKTIEFYMGVSERSMVRMGNRLKPE